MPVRRGDRAPDFTVETTEGEVTLRQLLERGPLVLVFYSEDATPTCTAEVSAFRDDHGTLEQVGANVLAVSADDLDSHRRFAEQQGGFPFPLASDPDLALAHAYDVVSDGDKRSRRAVFVIDRDGTVREANDHYQPQDMTQFASVFSALGLEM
jgi:peroxiredoxin